jgi:hypothetical protein
VRFGRLWGHDRGLDYWTALARGEVPGPEQRAVALLKRVVDPYRFSLYCLLGRLPVMGNVTRTLYLVEKGGGVVELEDGFGIASWCISIGPHSEDVPGTDHVVALRSIIEGEEMAFLRTGNRGRGGMFGRVCENPYVQSPFEEPFGPKEESRLDRMIGTDQLLFPTPEQEETAMLAGPIAVADGGAVMGDDMHGEYVVNDLGDYVRYNRGWRRRRPRAARRYRRDDPDLFGQVAYDVGQEMGRDVRGNIRLGPMGQHFLGQAQIPVRNAGAYDLMA